MCDFVCWRSTHPEVAEELVAIGWWEDRGQHYEIIHHAGYQRPRHRSPSSRLPTPRTPPRAGRGRSLRHAIRKAIRNAKWPGQDRPGYQQTTYGSAREDADDDYAEDLPDWYAEGERGRLEELADRNMRDGYDR